MIPAKGRQLYDWRFSIRRYPNGISEEVYEIHAGNGAPICECKSETSALKVIHALNMFGKYKPSHVAKNRKKRTPPKMEN
jgi:hypothetical protein